MLKSWAIKHRYNILFVAFLIVFYGYNINRIYGFVFFPDEFGYWAYAAALSGYDWSDITAMGSYYSYGYSLILFPIFRLISDALIAYRVAVTVNFVLIGVDFFLLIAVVKKIIPSQSENMTKVMACIAVFYPANLFYAKTTMVETVLLSVFLLICVLLVYYLENNKLPYLLLTIVAIVYIHFIHMRTVGVAVAAVITLLIYFSGYSKKAKHFIVAIMIGAGCIVAGYLIKKWAQGTLYKTTDLNTLNINDYAGQLDKVKYIFTEEGIKAFVCSLCGKVLYLGISSFGLFYFGCAYCVRQIKGYIISKEKRQSCQLLFMFLLLTAAGEIAINAIYNIRPIRVDSVVYGRYDEFVLPVFMVIGMIELINVKRYLMSICGIAAIEAIMTWATVYQVTKLGTTNIHGYVMVGMSYLHETVGYETTSFFWMTLGVGCIGMVVVCGIIRIATKRKTQYILYAVVVIEFLLFLRASSLYIDPTSLGTYRDMVLCDKVQSLIDEDKDRRVVYIDADEDAFIGSMQFILRDTDIKVQPVKVSLDDYTENEISKKDIIVISFNSDYGDILKEGYTNDYVYGKFHIYYN